MKRSDEIRATRRVLETLPAKVRVHRQHRKQSYRVAAEIIGCPYGHLCDFENGRIQPGLPFILDLLAYLEK